MKKVLLVLIVSVVCITYTNAQFTKLGGGAGFTTGYYFHDMKYDYNKSGNLFFYGKGIYELNLPIHISPSITYYFPHFWKDPQMVSEEHRTIVTTMMIDLNGHYVFNSLDRLELYGLAGVNVLLAWKKDVYDMAGAVSKYKESDNGIGLNLGLGTYIKMTEQIDLSIEAKYLISKYSQFMLNAGVLLNLQWLAKHEKDGL